MVKRTDLCPHRSYILVGERQEEKNEGRKERVKEKRKTENKQMVITAMMNCPLWIWEIIDGHF